MRDNDVSVKQKRSGFEIAQRTSAIGLYTVVDTWNLGEKYAPAQYVYIYCSLLYLIAYIIRMPSLRYPGKKEFSPCGLASHPH